MRSYGPVSFLFIVTISSATFAAAPPDPVYQSIRDAPIQETLVVKDLVLHRDIGTITLKSGTIGFTAPALGRDTVAVFEGEGEFVLTPLEAVERRYLRSLTQVESVKESFDRAMFVFTDKTGEEVRSHLKETGTNPHLTVILNDYRKHLRNLDTDNLAADLLMDLYEPSQPGFFSAYLHGLKHNDLRFQVKPRGAEPSSGPEEVMAINVRPAGVPDEVWYLAHLKSEIEHGKPNLGEHKRAAQAERYKIETTIAKNDHFTATTTVVFRAVKSGTRVLPIHLLQTLRVSRVVSDGMEAPFIQEDKKLDGALYVVLAHALEAGSQHELVIDYQGDKVVHKAGGGNFSVGARESWYPNLNPFHDVAQYDLTFKVPKQDTLVSVGKLARQWTEEGLGCTQWTSETPLRVAGFNYGTFKKKVLVDKATGVAIEGYANGQVPDYLEAARLSDVTLEAMSPSRLIDQSMVEAQNAVRIYTAWFGELPLGRLAVTQQPDFDFGQSWPSLVYLPMIAYLDATQRHSLMGTFDPDLNQFVEEVTPHEVAHQWWGHMVGDATYHDTWLSEGFADFSAAVYLQMTEKSLDKFNRFWERTRQRILTKNQFGISPKDAGPLSMGFRLTTDRNRGAYNSIVYGKGAYVLHMLRQMMYDNKEGDRPFIAMMHDFVHQHLNQDATTESFQQVAEKHMVPRMNVTGDGKLDWFFSEWVYGSTIPKYTLEYTLTPDSTGKCQLKGSITQSEVPDDFRMLVPLYADFDGGLTRLATASFTGNRTINIDVTLPQKPKRVLINALHDVLEQ